MPDIAITCAGVWKSYRIYHQRSHTLKEKVLSRRNMFEDFWALRGIDLTIGAGERVAFLGPSGCGKSTLLTLLGGIQRPSAGRVFLGDEEISRLGERRLTRVLGSGT